MQKLPLLLAFALLVAPTNLLAQNKKGKPVPEISLPGPLGNSVSLSSLKGKVILVDFWASWCRPCRNNNPNLVELHEKYKEKGFEIFSVSIDEDKSAWMAAISADHLFWPHVVDTDGWRSVVASKFSVEAIPSSFLVDKNGFIRGYDMNKDDLDKAIASLLVEE